MNSRFLTITVSSAMGLLLMSAGPARAQSAPWSAAPTAYANDDYRTSYADAQRAAYDNGYRDGLRRGEQAARDGRPLDIERERDYRGADNGYNRSHGDRNRYRDNYRGGFSQGFRDGYSRAGSRQRYPDNGRDYGRSGSPGGGVIIGGRPPYGGGGYGGGGGSYGAYQNGVSDGYKKGLDDAHDRKYPDVTRQKWYRSGDHDYNNRYGSKELYRNEYRRGFEEGYNRAYREGRR